MKEKNKRDKEEKRRFYLSLTSLVIAILALIKSLWF